MKISSGKTRKVKLTNRGDLALYFIGAGSAFAKTLNQTNLLVVSAQDHLLIDCGSRCSQALHAVGLPLTDIRNFVITHSHADHIGGLEEAQLTGRYLTRKKPHMLVNRRYEKILWEQSLRGGSEKSEGGGLAFSDFWTVTRPVKLKGFPRETWDASVGSINIKMPRTMHFPDSATSWRNSAWSCAIVINNKILFSSDTRFDSELIESYDKLFNFEVIFHDCQLFTGGVHASLDELSTLPLPIKRKMILMHYGDNWRDHRLSARQAGFHSWAREGHTYTFPD